MRTLLVAALLSMVMLVAMVPGASAGDAKQECVEVDSNGDPITVGVSPSGCYELGRPAWNQWNEQCRWLMQNPNWPDNVWCNDDL